MSDSLVTGLQAVVVALFVLIGQVAVARVSKGAQTEVAEVDAQAKATQAWQDYAAEMKNRIDRMETRLEDAERSANDDRRRIAALERQSEADKDLIRRLVGRLRRALDEIRRLGGTVSDADMEVLDLSNTRLELELRSHS